MARCFRIPNVEYMLSTLFCVSLCRHTIPLHQRRSVFPWFFFTLFFFITCCHFSCLSSQELLAELKQMETTMKQTKTAKPKGPLIPTCKDLRVELLPNKEGKCLDMKVYVSASENNIIKVGLLKTRCFVVEFC